MSGAQKVSFEFSNFRLDGKGQTLLRNGWPVSLTPKALEILLVLVRNHGRLVAKEELMSAVWPGTFVEEGNLTWCIS
ncbi:MAG: winged helix-turn-helix domain-containing protein, partial [Acidobacteria bacterium]|nr:winged helix-turn-helix domain-containing protein [Acidobacteriota bacterium]